MKTLWQGLRFGFRQLIGKPGFTLIAALTLGAVAVSGQEKAQHAPPMRTRTKQAQIIARLEKIIQPKKLRPHPLFY